MSGLPQISILRHVRRILRCMTGKVPSNCSAIDAWSMSTEYLISYSSLSFVLSLFLRAMHRQSLLGSHIIGLVKQFSCADLYSKIFKNSIRD